MNRGAGPSAGAVIISAILVVVGGCASKEPTVPTGIESNASGSSTPLQQGEIAGRPAMVWRNPNADLRKYNRVIVEQVAVYRGPDANFGGMSEQDLNQLAEFTRSEFIRAIGPYAASAAGPGVARLKVTIAGAEGNVPVASTVSRVLPVGLAMNLAKEVADQPGSFTGSVTLAGQLTDAQTGTPLVTGVQKSYPSAMNVGATLSSRDAQQAAITQAADGFRKRMDAIHNRTG